MDSINLKLTSWPNPVQNRISSVTVAQFTAGDEENNPKTPDAPTKEDLVAEIEMNQAFDAPAARIKLMNLITELSQN